jgi:hypothetical protein
VLEKEAFQKQMLEKLIWIAAFMLVGARHPGATVGAVEKDYRSEASTDKLDEILSAVLNFILFLMQYLRSNWDPWNFEPK